MLPTLSTQHRNSEWLRQAWLSLVRPIIDDTVQVISLEIKVQTSPYKPTVTTHDHLSTENRSDL